LLSPLLTTLLRACQRARDSRAEDRRTALRQVRFYLSTISHLLVPAGELSRPGGETSALRSASELLPRLTQSAPVLLSPASATTAKMKMKVNVKVKVKAKAKAKAKVKVPRRRVPARPRSPHPLALRHAPRHEQSCSPSTTAQARTCRWLSRRPGQPGPPSVLPFGLNSLRSRRLALTYSDLSFSLLSRALTCSVLLII
jgi:hypothetical protein